MSGSLKRSRDDATTSTANQDPSSETAGLGAYECAICMSLPEGRVHQCANGHHFCEECLTQLNNSYRPNAHKCPTCRISLPTQRIRCLAAERAISQLHSRCKYCSEESTRGSLRAHEEKCPERTFNCSAVKDGCKWVGRAEERTAHESGCVHCICLSMIASREQQWDAERAALQAQLDGLSAHVLMLQPTTTETSTGGEHVTYPYTLSHKNDIDPKGTFQTFSIPSFRMTSGKWYYEVHLPTPVDSVSNVQIGWATVGFSPKATFNESRLGVGDDNCSWGFDGIRKKLWHSNGVEDDSDSETSMSELISTGPRMHPYKDREWIEGDLIGLLLDLDTPCGGAQFSLNGVVSESDFDMVSIGSGMFPALSTNTPLSVNFGLQPLRHLPAGYSPVADFRHKLYI